MITLLLAVFAFAEIPSGQWQGKGIYEAWGVGRFESDARIEIESNPSVLKIKDCWKFERQGKPWNLCYEHTFDRKGEELYVEETKVGNVRESEMEIIYKRDEGQIHAILRWDEQNRLSGFHNAVSRTGRYTNKSSDLLEPMTQ